MMPPCEIMGKVVLPALRGVVAHELQSQGYSQLKIASFLGVSQSAISQMLSKPRETHVKTLLNVGIGQEELKTLVKLLAEDVPRDQVRATLTLYSFWMDFLSRGAVCGYHKRIYRQLDSCDICISGKTSVEDPDRKEILERLEKAVRLVEGARYFVNVMPQVAVNIVESVRHAKTVDDVAGVPGRIVVLRDRPKAVSRPEFGGSRHLAKVLLAVKKYVPEVNSVMNLKLDERVMEAVVSLGMKHSVTKKEATSKTYTEDEVVEAVASEFGEHGFLDVVFEKGGYGIEPITYLFGENSMDVVEKAMKIARRYIELSVSGARRDGQQNG